MEPREYEIMYRAEQCHWWYQGMAAITRNILDVFYAPGSGLAILDAGCGTGAGLLFLSQYGSVTGLDISSYALRSVPVADAQRSSELRSWPSLSETKPLIL